MSYEIIIHPKAFKEIQKLSHQYISKVEQKIDELADSPRPSGYKKLVNFHLDRVPNQDCYRIRVGSVRIIYTIHDTVLTIIIAQVKKRGDIY